MGTVPSTSSWVPGIGILAGKRSCLEVTSFLSSMFSGNMVAQAYKGDDDGRGGQPYESACSLQNHSHCWDYGVSFPGNHTALCALNTWEVSGCIKTALGSLGSVRWVSSECLASIFPAYCLGASGNHPSCCHAPHHFWKEGSYENKDPLPFPSST